MTFHCACHACQHVIRVGCFRILLADKEIQKQILNTSLPKQLKQPNGVHVDI